MKRVMILAGGTGGHIYPGLAVAEALRAQGVEVSWMGSQAKMALEKDLVPEHFPLHTVAVSQLRNKGLAAKLLFPFQITHAIWQAMNVLRCDKPDVCVAFGGFVSGPGGIAAKLLGIPLIIHEQNARAGLTNRYLAKVATTVLQAFPNAFPKAIKATTVGNPVRQDILDLPTPSERLSDHHGPLRILVLGGSLGAKALNESVVAWLQAFARTDEVTIQHQTGKLHFDLISQQYKQHGLIGDVKPYIEDMSRALAWADVVICRAGALTVSEVADVGIAAVFVPMPNSVDNHQYHNANYLASHAAAILIEQKELSSSTLSRVIESYLNQRECVLDYAEKARALSMRDSCQQILTHLKGVTIPEMVT